MNPRSLKAILADQLEVKSITIEQLSTKTGVPEHYLKAIFNNQPERLPALPYIRNYLLTIAEFLEINKEVILEAYRVEFSAKMSGPSDRLPGNRFALEGRNRKWVWVSVFGIVGVAIAYAVLRTAFFGVPYFRLVNPPQDAEMFEVSGSTILLTGTTESNGKLSINGEMVPVRVDGSFEFEFPLVAGIPNTIEFKVERFLGKTLTVVKKVYVRPEEVAETDFEVVTGSSTPSSTFNSSPLETPAL